jgi:hypothetical protein
LVRNTETGYMRAGVVMSVWDATSATYTDNSTPDLNGSTVPISFTVTNNGTNVLLSAVVTSGTWLVKVGTRIIF